MFALKMFITLLILPIIFVISHTVEESNVDIDVINNLSLDVKYDGENELFPEEFTASFQAFAENINTYFRLTNEFKQNHIFIIDSVGLVEKFNLTERQTKNLQSYNEIDGDSMAFLIKDENNQFKIFGTIYTTNSEGETIAYDVSPSNDYSLSEYTIRRRTISNLVDQYPLLNNRIKRQIGSTAPVALTVETLVVTDKSIYDSHLIRTGSNSSQEVIFEMKIYYSLLINEINKRFQNSLKNDSNLRINIILKNFLILTTPVNWTNVNVVGDVNVKTYKDKDVIVDNLTLNEFKNYMNSIKMPVSYDYAIGLFNKDLWSSNKSQDSDTRSMVNGFSWQSSICSDKSFSISEDFGGFSNIISIAHEIGHTLGSDHDGIAGISDACPTIQNFIMTPSPIPLNIQNLYSFSPCSINQFKKFLLNNAMNNVSIVATCLIDVPASLPNETFYAESTLPGQIWGADEQCKMIYGPDASFCQISSNMMCSSLFCRNSSSVVSCLTSVEGAMEGTPCEPGKICIQGVCTKSDLAPTNQCVFGDDIITDGVIPIQLTSIQMKCNDVFKLIESNKTSVSGYCANPFFQKFCCQSCQKYLALKCADKLSDCPSNRQSCTNDANFQKNCPQTCGQCDVSPLRCADNTFICTNAGVCMNTTVSDTSLFGFNCTCPKGYSGELCELENDDLDLCSPNPCLNNGKCVSIGQGYICECAAPCSGIRCSVCPVNSSTPTSATSTLSTTRILMSTKTLINNSANYIGLNRLIFNCVYTMIILYLTYF